MAAAHLARRLFLHPSALSDAEYAVYVGALPGLPNDEDHDRHASNQPDDELERRAVGLRKVHVRMKRCFRDIVIGSSRGFVDDTEDLKTGKLPFSVAWS